MRLTCLLASTLAWEVAFANPIVVIPTVDAYKDRAIVTIVAERESAVVTGKFHYRTNARMSQFPLKFRLEVPVFLPREGHAPPSQRDMWSPQANPHQLLGSAVNLRYVSAGRDKTMQSCRTVGPETLKVPLPSEIASSTDIAMCWDEIESRAGELPAGMNLDVNYRQYYVMTHASGSWNLVYLPLFEVADGKRRGLGASPKDFLVEVRAAPGLALRLVSRNKATANTSTLVRVVPRHGESIVIEVK